MDVDRFWQIIDETRAAADGDPRRQSELLEAALTRETPEDILAFDEIARELDVQASTAHLREALLVIEGRWASDDIFSEWRAWLIGRGRDVFLGVLADPETLADIVEIGRGNVFPTLLGAANAACEKVTGQPLPPRPEPGPALPGEAPPDAHLLLQRYARLRVKYWDWWMQKYGF